MAGDGYKDELLFLSDVARIMKCSQSHVRRLAKQGSLPYLQPGGLGTTIYIRRSSFEDWLEREEARNRELRQQ